MIIKAGPSHEKWHCVCARRGRYYTADMLQKWRSPRVPVQFGLLVRHAILRGHDFLGSGHLLNFAGARPPSHFRPLNNRAAGKVYRAAEGLPLVVLCIRRA